MCLKTVAENDEKLPLPNEEKLHFELFEILSNYSISDPEGGGQNGN